LGFVVDKVALGQVFSKYFGFSCQSSFHQLLHNHHHLSSGAGTIGQQWLTYQVDSVSPHPKKLFKKYCLSADHTGAEVYPGSFHGVLKKSINISLNRSSMVQGHPWKGDTQLVKKSPAFMDPQGSSASLQKVANGLHLEVDIITTYFLKNHFTIWIQTNSAADKYLFLLLLQLLSSSSNLCAAECTLPDLSKS
jgi:hypothetical protein